MSMTRRENVQQTPAPPEFKISEADILDNARLLIDTVREVQATIVATVPIEAPTFLNVLLPLVRAENEMAARAGLLRFYRDVSHDAELRRAATNATAMFDEFAAESAANADLFRLLKRVSDSGEVLDTESHRLLALKLKTSIDNGAGLSAEKQLVFQQTNLELRQLTAECMENLATADVWLWFTEKELEGHPSVHTLESGTEEHLGKYQVRIRQPDVSVALFTVKDSRVRQRIYVAHENACAQNESLLKQILICRDKAARLLGYSDHASRCLRGRMAKSPIVVNAFLEDLATKLRPAADIEVAKLLGLKRADCKARGEEAPLARDYFLWDHAFYHRHMLQTQCRVDKQLVSDYFPLEAVLEAILGILEELFGLALTRVDGDVWHEDVRMFEVREAGDSGGLFVGYLYLDLFYRDGKISSPVCINLIPGFEREDGTRQFPATTLCCSFQKPTIDNPTLLSHDDVYRHLFHELGHCIHDLVSKTRYACFHGTAVAIDFGEAPSQMLEEWCWVPSVLKGISKHYSYLSTEHFGAWKSQAGPEASQPPLTIPDSMIKSLLEARYLNSALFTLRQVSIGVVDMAFHQPETSQQIQDWNLAEKWNNTRAKILPLSGPGESMAWGHGYASIPHFFNNEYDAGYYSYLYSQVYAKDLFRSCFEKDPMNIEEARKYRRGILEPGGSKDEMDILVKFLGREPSSQAFSEDIGISARL